jgi:hypothetical protein
MLQTFPDPADELIYYVSDAGEIFDRNFDRVPPKVRLHFGKYLGLCLAAKGIYRMFRMRPHFRIVKVTDEETIGR